MQPIKAAAPISTRAAALLRLIELILWQESKADSPMRPTPAGTTSTFVALLQLAKAPSSISSSASASCNWICWMFTLFAKAPIRISSTRSGM